MKNIIYNKIYSKNYISKKIYKSWLEYSTRFALDTPNSPLFFPLLFLSLVSARPRSDRLDFNILSLSQLQSFFHQMWSRVNNMSILYFIFSYRPKKKNKLFFPLSFLFESNA